MPQPFCRLQSNKKPARIGFSLVELLVVIAIIGVLAGLKVTGLNFAKSKAQQAAGASAMRGIGTAVLLYSNEHGGRLPGPLFSNQVATRGSPKNGFLVNWLALLGGGFGLGSRNDCHRSSTGWWLSCGGLTRVISHKIFG